jgi:myo-inositol 2-dehydrogenase/D-chiro-inositol 1-dehydrogenase
MPDSQPLSVGLVGAGGMGTRHGLNLHEHVGGARLVGVYDPDLERARQLAGRCDSAAVFEDPLGVIEDDRVDAVIIASPDATHLDFVLACVAAGKPVLCEKPLATSAEGAARVVEAECAAGRRLVSVGLMRRFDPYHVAVNEIARSGRLGRPVLYKGVHRNAAIPYDSRGEVILTNSAGHDIDAVRWLLGQEIETMYVRGVRSHAAFSPETTDLLLLQMSLTGDCLATVEVFAAAEYGYEVTAEIVGERGVATSGRPDRALVRANAAAGVSLPGEWLERFQEAYVSELREWVRSVRSGVVFGGASAWDGYLTLLVTDACVRSLRMAAPVAVQTPARPALYEKDH